MTPADKCFEHLWRYTNLVSLQTCMKRLSIEDSKCIYQHLLQLIFANMFFLTLGSDVPFSSPGSGAGLEYSPDKRPYPSFALL